MQLAGQEPWWQILNDILSKQEQKEKNHILEEGEEAERKFERMLDK